MDRFNVLSDELLVKILLFLPTKVAVTTSILSKRWEFLWMWLPKLEFNDRNYSPTQRKKLQCFLERNLPLHRALVIESFSLHVSAQLLKPKDIKMWVMTALSRILHKLEISCGSSREPRKILPSNVYTCKSLVTLKLDGNILLDVPRMVCLPSLKTLQLISVKYFSEDCLQRLLSNCHVLEDVLVLRNLGETMKKFTVNVPSLQRLSLCMSECIQELNILPSNLYTWKLLVALKLDGNILLDVPRMVCLPSLKTLEFQRVKYSNDDCLQRLLSNCPVLEDLLVRHSNRFRGEHMKRFTVIVPSLQRLSLYIFSDVDEFVINTPSLKYIKLVHHNSKNYYFSMENMPKLIEADIDVQFPDLKSLIKSITSVKRLNFCVEANVNPEDVYGGGFVFNRLEHLKLCSCAPYLGNVLVWLLDDSPNLRGLEFYQMKDHANDGLVYWNQPNTVPDCMLTSLQTLTWSDYWGRPEERDFVVYILENARVLKTATISPYAEDSLSVKHKMVKDLALCSRASTACKLVFD